MDKYKTVDIIGFPMNLGANRRGVDLGPAALRIAGLWEMLSEMGYPVYDKGDIPVPRPDNGRCCVNPNLKYLDEIAKAAENLGGEVEKTLDSGHFPLVIGGDHSMAVGTISGVSSYCRKKNKKLGVIWIDAHADMNLEDTTPSGNIHGMPLAVSLGCGNKKLTHLLGFSPKVTPENCVIVGCRRIDEKERDVILSKDLPLYTMKSVDYMGIGNVMDIIAERFSRTVDAVHVSFDMDVVDPSVATGVGTPVSGGLTFREAHLIMEIIASMNMIVSLEIAEINPILDLKNQSAEFAVGLIASCLGRTII